MRKFRLTRTIRETAVIEVSEADLDPNNRKLMYDLNLTENEIKEAISDWLVETAFELADSENLWNRVSTENSSAVEIAND